MKIISFDDYLWKDGTEIKGFSVTGDDAFWWNKIKISIEDKDDMRFNDSDIEL